MSGYQDFDAVKREVSIEQAAQKLGLELKKSGMAQFRCACPACPNAGPRALVITPAKGFYCWGAKKGGDQIALVVHVMNLSVKDAAAFLVGNQRTSSSTVPESGGGREGNRTLTPLTYLEPEDPAVEAIGFSVEFAKTHGIGFAPKGVVRGSVAIPFRDEHGTLLGYIGVQELTYIPPSFTPNVVPFEKKAS